MVIIGGLYENLIVSFKNFKYSFTRSQKLKKMNKFIFEIILKNNNGVEIDILHWDHRFIYDTSNFHDRPFSFFKSSNNFSIYSLSTGGMYDTTLEIPEYKNLFKDGKFKGAKINKNFKSEEDRYLYLKGIYRCLSEWSVNYEKFKNDNIDNDRIIINGNFWIK